MAPVIPVKCSEIEDCPGRAVTHIEFTIPSLKREFIAEFTPSRAGAAIKRLVRIIDLEIEGAPAGDIVDALEKFLKPAKRAQNATLTDDEVAEYRRANGWDIEPAPRTPEDVYREAVEVLQPAPVEVAPAPVEPAAPVEDAPVVTSDGRYIVDPVAGTIEPVEDIPADIVAVMPVWEVRNDQVEFWPRSFDIDSDNENAFQIEQEAAAALFVELGGILWGACSDDVQIDPLGNTARLIDSGVIIGPDGRRPASTKSSAGV